MLGVPPRFPRGIRIRPLAAFLLLLALAPVAFTAASVLGAARNIVYWDEFDTALNLLIQLDEGMGLSDFLGRLFAVSNEHRMVTSRLMFAASYWLTGTIDFAVIGTIGNASLVALCCVLVWAAGTTERRVRLALLLGMLLFQLEHYENFLWSGSSIDHFQVVLLAAVAIVALGAEKGGSFAVGVLAATLATFTLAHGILAWPVGAAMLAQARRHRELAIWGVIGALAIAVFFAGFHVNQSQRFAEVSLAGIALVVHYWLALLGAVPALGHQALAPWLGALLLVAIAGSAALGASRRERVAFPLAVYAIAALALIAVGRAAETNGTVYSRYYVLGALAWALVGWMWLERFSHARQPYVLLLGSVPLLVTFNIAANHVFSSRADAWIECRDRAALQFKQDGVDGRGPFALYPTPARSTELLQRAEQRGLYRLEPLCLPREFPGALPSSRIAYFVEEMAVSDQSAFVGGWAAIPGVETRRGQVHIVLRSPTETHVFTAVTIRRPDVVRTLDKEEWEYSGFRFVGRREDLPTGEYEIGFLIDAGGAPEYIMTAHKVRLVGKGEALLATAD
jgi:hypothetical protein